MYEKIKDLCIEKGITITALERELGIAKGSLSKIDKHKPSANKIQKIADYFNVPIDYLTGSNIVDGDGYYVYGETAELAQTIFDNKELRALFDVQRDMSADDLQAMYGMALALKRKERGTDDTGC